MQWPKQPCTAYEHGTCSTTIRAAVGGPGRPTLLLKSLPLCGEVREVGGRTVLALLVALLAATLAVACAGTPVRAHNASVAVATQRQNPSPSAARLASRPAVPFRVGKQLAQAANQLRAMAPTGGFRLSGCPAIGDLTANSSAWFACFSRVLLTRTPTSGPQVAGLLHPFRVRLLRDSVVCGAAAGHRHDPAFSECDAAGITGDIPVSINILFTQVRSPRVVRANVKFEVLSSYSESCQDGLPLCMVGGP